NDRLLRHRRRNRETGVLRQPRQQLHASLEDLLEVEYRLGEIARDRTPLRVPEAAARGQRVDVVPVADVGGDAAGAGVRVGEVAELLERGHLVADRGAGHADARPLRDRLTPDRLPGADVLLDDRVQDRGLAWTELGSFDHDPMIRSTPAGRVLTHVADQPAVA